MPFSGSVSPNGATFPYWLLSNAHPSFGAILRKKGKYLLFRIARRNTGWALENNLFGKIAPYRELCGIRSSPVSEAFIVLEHVTWWPTPWEPFHHSLELANENCLARGPKNGPVRGDHF